MLKLPVLHAGTGTFASQNRQFCPVINKLLIISGLSFALVYVLLLLSVLELLSYEDAADKVSPYKNRCA